MQWRGHETCFFWNGPERRERVAPREEWLKCGGRLEEKEHDGME